ncbi:MAG: TIGR02444 family protein [Pseudohongiellaceae bacterium]
MGINTRRFWDFSYKVYTNDGIDSLCLQLQDERGFDINLVLFCLWFGVTRGELTDAALARARQHADAWRTLKVQPLRNLRRHMKRRLEEVPAGSRPAYGQLRERIKRCELEAERLQQQILERLAGQLKGTGIAGAGAMTANLERLAMQMGMVPDGDLKEKFTRLRVAGDSLDSPPPPA